MRLGACTAAVLAAVFAPAPAAQAATVTTTATVTADYVCESLRTEYRGHPYVGYQLWAIGNNCAGPVVLGEWICHTVTDGTQTWGCGFWSTNRNPADGTEIDGARRTRLG